MSIRELLRAAVHDGRFQLAGVDPASTPGVDQKNGGVKGLAKQVGRDGERLAELQERLRAEGTRSLLVVLQGMDTSGKDGTIKRVVGSMNPQGCRIASFKKPTPEELAHDFLWRISKQLPGAGEVVVFNRSHYEDVVIVRVHELVPRQVWSRRYAAINRFERDVIATGTILVKVFLHISFAEQRRRLLRRLDDPSKHWKFDPADIDERAHWDAYQLAYSDAIARCSTERAPWYVVPADSKRYRDWAVGRLLVEALEEADLRYPDPELDVDALKRRLR